ncbi:MAG: DUF4147 domain-containing protein [Acidimicrobiia bacterium]|nr:DUF4147 domain-containing protein [Acidimicrobiia bacterium]
MTGGAFDRRAIANDPGRRGSLMRVFAGALDAVDPEAAVLAALQRDEDRLTLAGRPVELAAIDRCLVLAFGKASVPMARGIIRAVDGMRVEGIVVTNQVGAVPGLRVVEGSHPVPDERSVAAATELLDLARGAGPNDLVMVAISGGGSSLLTMPAGGLKLSDLAATTSLLLRSSASIGDLNTVRKHLSAVSGGRLIEAAAGAGVVLTLVISDVVGNDLEIIASGPTVPDHSTYREAAAVLDRYGVAGRVPVPVLEHLTAGEEGRVPETPVEGVGLDRQTIAIIADATRAAEGAAEAARKLGWEPELVSATVTGEAREVAVEIVGAARELRPGELLIYAGETTVTVAGDGRGGRNQELALAAAAELAGSSDLVLLSAGTDGIDGVTEAAGAFADGWTVERGVVHGLDAADFLARNDSYSYLSTVGDVIVTGPTGTNVGDLILVARSG